MGWVASAVVTAGEWDTSFDRLFTAEYTRVVGIAHRVLGDVHEAEDVAQDVFCAFYRAHSPEAHYAAAWLHRAAAHTALNVVRGRSRRHRRESAQTVEHHRLAIGGEGSNDPQHAVEVEESRREVQDALGRLSEKSAAVLALRYSGLSYSEVAAALGITAGQVGTRLRRAEAALRKEMTHQTSR
jgi:RNA polymerase sigma-70 factor (ECF subfamily)